MPLPEVLRTEENAQGGILVVVQPGCGPVTHTSVRRAFLFDKSVDRGPVLNRFAEWFALWGIELQRVRGTEGCFERSFFSLQWPPDPVQGHGPQTVAHIAEHAAALRDELIERRPRLIIFLSCYLWQAVNLPQAISVLEPVCGHPLESGRRITNERLGAYLQRWTSVTMLALPQPSKNTTEKCVRAMAQGVRDALQACAPAPHCARDPLRAQAMDYVYLDREKTIRLMAVGLHVQLERAAAIFDSLKDEVWVNDPRFGPRLKSD